MLRLKRICLEDLSDVRGTIPEDGDDYLEESGIEASEFIDWGMINFINDFIDNLQMVDLPMYPNRKPNDNKGNVKSMSRYYIDAQADLMSMPIPKLYKKCIFLVML